ncbi:MAG: hypothetical protein WCS27_10410 [Victivallaceae bacterium]
MFNCKRDFYTGLFILLFIPAALFINFFILKDLYPKELPDNKLVNNYKKVEKLKRISNYCLNNHPGAMLVLARYYRREKLFDAEQCWLLWAVKSTKSPLAMFVLSQKFSELDKPCQAAFWYSEAVKRDSRIKSAGFRRALEKELKQRVRELYEK